MSNELTHNPGQFDEVIHIIDNARSRAMKAVNAELIQMYWEIGSYVSGRVKDGGWGKSVVADFSEFLQAHYPGTKGFSAQNIWRMKQFYETYCDNEKLSPLVREIPWTSNLLIMTGCKTDEAREFYLRLCIANRYTKRELDRQIGSMLYERTMISHEKHKDLLAGNGGLAALRDSYNYQHGTQTISLDEIASALSSDFDGASPPKNKRHAKACLLFFWFTHFIRSPQG